MSRFITFEGPEGGGKSTQITLLADYYRARGATVYCTREPGGTEIGERIRQLVHDVKHTEMTPLAEILLYSASRAQLVNEFIQPKLAQGAVILCDRYADSTYAYQGYGRGLDLDALRQITRFATNALQPDLTIFLDVPVALGLERKQQANRLGEGEWNRMDQLTLDFYQRVRQGYLEMAQMEPGRWQAVDATQPVEVVHQQICEVVSHRFT